MTVSIHKRADHLWEIAGDLVIPCIPELLGQTNGLFTSGGEAVVDLDKVGRIDSAGLALLVEWMRCAKRQGVTLRFQNVPERMWAIAKISGLHQILPRESFKG